MTTEEELQKAYREMNDKDERISKLTKELQDCWKIEEIILAAGLLEKEKFDQARAIINSFGCTSLLWHRTEERKHQQRKNS